MQLKNARVLLTGAAGGIVPIRLIFGQGPPFSLFDLEDLLQHSQGLGLGHPRGQEQLAGLVQPQRDRGDLIVIAAPSGAGKTTLMRSLSGVLQNEAGMITLDQYLQDLLARGLISKQDARRRAANKETFQ